ncbi:MAG: PARP-type zinc finger-containing protein [Candidatus Thorarchaeota archaeon]
MASDYKIEYSKSSRATCQVCGEKIEKGDIRIGVPSYFQAYLSYKWQHAKCTQFGGAVPLPKDMKGADQIELDDLNILQVTITVVDPTSLTPTKIVDVITPDKIYQRIDAKITRIGKLMDNTDGGGSISSNITISDGENNILILGNGPGPARELIGLDLNGEYQFLGLKAILDSKGSIILKHEGGAKFVLVKSGIKQKVISSDDWGEYKDTKLTISNRKATCSICSEEIPKFTFRYTTRGEKDVRGTGQMWKVDIHSHVKCADVKTDVLVNIWNHIIKNKIYESWRYPFEKIEQAYLDLRAEIKRASKVSSEKLLELPKVNQE